MSLFLAPITHSISYGTNNQFLIDNKFSVLETDMLCQPKSSVRNKTAYQGRLSGRQKKRPPSNKHCETVKIFSNLHISISSPYNESYRLLSLRFRDKIVYVGVPSFREDPDLSWSAAPALPQNLPPYILFSEYQNL